MQIQSQFWVSVRLCAPLWLHCQRPFQVAYSAGFSICRPSQMMHSTNKESSPVCCVHVCLQLSQLTRPAAMFVFPVQVSSPSSLLLRLSYEAEGQRNERQGGEAHSDLWYEISSLSTVGNFHICAYDFSLLFFFYQRRTWTAKQRMRSR